MIGCFVAVLLLFAAGEGTSYSEAHRAALETGRPMVVWVGGNFCERCVEDSKEEFVHHFADPGWNGVRGPATVVYVPHNRELHLAGTVTNWVVGSAKWGHLASVRTVVAEWRQQVKSGDDRPLRLLNYGDGNWGMSHNKYYSSHIGQARSAQSTSNYRPQIRRGRGG